MSLKAYEGEAVRPSPVARRDPLSPATQGLIQPLELSCTPLGICSQSISGAWEQ